MSNAVKALAGLVVALGLTFVVAGCSSEQSSLTLKVTVDPNPVTGTDEDGGRRWDFAVSITNPNPVGVYVESFHIKISNTDSGYKVPLVLVKESDVIGQYIAAGATGTYAASRDSSGNFTRGSERRIYHALGNDGKYYSGEVVIVLQ